MFFAAFTSASKMLPQLVQTNRDRLMRLAASTVPQELQHCEVSAGSTTMIRDPYHGALYYSIVRIIWGETSSSAICRAVFAEFDYAGQEEWIADVRLIQDYPVARRMRRTRPCPHG
jgi:hypothetical protein